MLLLLLSVVLASLPSASAAQTVGEVFRKVQASVVVIRAKGREVETRGGPVAISEIGSGVLISATAA